MKKLFLTTLFCAHTFLFSFAGLEDFEFYNSTEEIKSQKIVKDTKRIYLPQYPEAYNPSIIKSGNGYLMCFRISPNRWKDGGLTSFIGIVRLNENFDPISEPQILDTRFGNSIAPQSEDARLFVFRDKIYLVYNDNTEEIWFNNDQRRDMYIAELLSDGDKYTVGKPLKLTHQKKYGGTKIQKNWMPFEWDKQLFLTYSILPHEILLPDFKTGSCLPIFETTPYMTWNYGPLRGGSPPILVDGEYLSFFHSSVYTSCPVTKGEKVWIYFMGAYTFSGSPPFELTKMSPYPIVGKGFYTYLIYWKRVIFPGGFVVSGNNIYLAYGKDDWEMWVATIDKKALYDHMHKVYIPDETIFE